MQQEHDSGLNPETIKEYQLRLLDKAKQVVRDVKPSDQLPTLRLYADDLFGGLGVYKDHELLEVLDSAKPIEEPVRGYQDYPADKFLNKDRFLWGDLLKARSFTMLSAQPKVGKTGFAVQLIGAVLRGDKSFLGQDITSDIDHCLIIGPDMHMEAWVGQYMESAGLGPQAREDGRVVIDFPITIWGRGQKINLSSSGIEKIVGECRRHKHSLILIDDYRSVTRDLRLEESKAAFAQPIFNLMQAVEAASLHVTGLVNHHSPKSSDSSRIESVASGSNALSGAFDGLIHLSFASNKFCDQDKEPLFLVESANRGAMRNKLLVKRTENQQWRYLQKGDDWDRMQKFHEYMERLQPSSHKVLDCLATAKQQGREIDTNEIASACNLEIYQARRFLASMRHKGVVFMTKPAKPSPLGGKTPACWSCIDEVSSYTSEQEPTTQQNTTFTSPLALKTPDVSSGFSETSVQGSQVAQKTEQTEQTENTGEDEPVLHQPVERLLAGKWEPGWLISEFNSSHNITIVKVGQPNYRIQNCRWMQEIRPAPGPFESSAKPPSCGF